MRRQECQDMEAPRERWGRVIEIDVCAYRRSKAHKNVHNLWNLSARECLSTDKLVHE